MVRPKTLLVLVTFLCLAGLAGCAFLAGAAVAGAGLAYVKGEGKKMYNEDVQTTYRAALDVVDDQRYVIVEKEADASSARIKAKQVDGDEVNIRVDRVGEDSSEVKIRIGLMGNESETRMLFSEIDDRL
jgi:hypothetical protein